MNKGLEAFENIKDEILEWTEGYEEDLDIIEKELKDFEWLISKLTIDFVHNLTDPEDKMRVLSFFGIRIAMEETDDE